MADQTLHTRLLAEIDSWADVNGRLSPPEAAARAAVELHAPVVEPLYENVVRLICKGCDPGMYAEEEPVSPCSTIQVIAGALGVPIEGDVRG
ncbi:hypothetical protein ACQP1P_38690 [Dactylosporangium sp. CA-052675]|uniref:hypothetical protein n=1 Tax=Dactylosporangium sp. CA-052675 TaxID=3239927 RepID=UPI003D8A7A92